jgi:hypothetical protein
VGDNTQWLSDKTLGVAQKLTDYAARVEQGVAAAKSGNVGLLASTAAGVASDLGGDLRLNDATRATIDKVGGQVRTAGAVADAVKRKDFAATGQLLGGVLKDEKLREAVNTAGAVADAVQRKDFAATGQLVGGVIKDEKLREAVNTAGAVADAVKRKDFKATGQLVGGALKNERLAQGARVTGQLVQGIKSKDAQEIMNAAATVTNVFGAGSEVRRLVEDAEAKKKEAEDVIAAALRKGPPPPRS